MRRERVIRRRQRPHRAAAGSIGISHRFAATRRAQFGQSIKLSSEKAVLACSSAVREWDSNGTNFGYNPERGATAGEFGHNDFYPVAVAAAQIAGLNGRQTLVAM